MAENKKPKLTAKQEMFCKEYLIDLNATQAAIRAEYPEKSARQAGSENLSKPYIAEYIQELFDKRSDKTEITSEYVITSIKSVAERCMQAEQVMAQGAPTGEYKFDAAGANKSLELLGRHLKLFTDRVELDGEVQISTITRKIVKAKSDT
jgi:phage terminase small subunit